MIVVYTNSNIDCPYCVLAKTLLFEHAIDYEERDIADPVIKAELLKRRPTARTVPQIFIGEHHVGGCDDLITLMNGRGGLELLIELYGGIDTID